MRKPKLWGALVTLLVLGAWAGNAVADASVEPKKAKPGGACKADDDCDQKERPQRCRDKKCEPRPTHPVT